MNDKKLEELHQYFTGYGSPHDELIIRLIKEYRLSIEEIYQHIEDKEELFKQNKRYREAINYVMKAKSSHYNNNLDNALDDIKFVINETIKER